MGFCRRCGDITSGPRCKCGGSSVAPVLSWNQGSSAQSEVTDRWSKTYVSTREKSPVRAAIEKAEALAPQTTGNARAAPPSPTKRFPRPASRSFSSASPGLENRVTAHITSTTTWRPPSPLKQTTVADPEEDILPALHARDGSLAKVYGSVLQPKESLQTHSCAICSSPFPPDTTIYPDPNSPTNRFLCRPCFETNGGSKGSCASCSRPVLALKSEGGFVQAANQIWHKRCFTCESCYKYIGDAPMVDLLGRPSCADCFDNCLAKDRTPRKNRGSNSNSVNNSPSVVVPIKSPSARTREGSPTIDELEHRLGINKQRESSPELEELSHRLNKLASSSPTKSRYGSGDYTRDGSPTSKAFSSREGSPLLSRARKDSGRKFPTSPELERSRPRFNSTSSSNRVDSPSPDRDAIEEMKRRFMKGSASPEPRLASPTTSPLRHAKSSGSMSILPSTLTSPISSPTSELFMDSGSSSSGLGSPPPSLLPKRQALEQDTPPLFYRSRLDSFDDADMIVEETPSQTTTPTRLPRPKANTISSPMAGDSVRSSPAAKNASATVTKCAKCFKLLYAVGSPGRSVTVPDDDDSGSAKSYHYSCFRCSICDEAFEEGANGQAVFVKSSQGACHMDCVPPVRVNLKTTIPRTNRVVIPPAAAKNQPVKNSSRYERPPVTASPAATPPSFPRFGGSVSCPGCHKSVAVMERGVVPGPHNTKWHATCLVCGGKKPSLDPYARGRPERKKDEPGCGKKLDSAAKTDVDGGVWCRECLLLLPRESASPIRSADMNASSAMPPAKVIAQMTGTTTIARQFTGLGGSGSGSGDGSLLRQMTGGGISPTRSISPTKQLGMNRPRPKSVVGMRSSKSVDEGRGMFLVRQMTGGGGM